jgi:hypothetical protein
MTPAFSRKPETFISRGLTRARFLCPGHAVLPCQLPSQMWNRSGRIFWGPKWCIVLPRVIRPQSGVWRLVDSNPNRPPLPPDDITRASDHQMAEEESVNSSQPSDGEKRDWHRNGVIGGKRKIGGGVETDWQTGETYGFHKWIAQREISEKKINQWEKNKLVTRNALRSQNHSIRYAWPTNSNTPSQIM